MCPDWCERVGFEYETRVYSLSPKNVHQPWTLALKSRDTRFRRGSANDTCWELNNLAWNLVSQRCLAVHVGSL